MIKTLTIGWAAVLGYMCGYTGYLIYRSHTLREDQRETRP